MKKKGSIMLIIIMAIVGAYLIYNHFNKDENINNNNKNLGDNIPQQFFISIIFYIIAQGVTS